MAVRDRSMTPRLIREIRRRRGWTQKELAAAIGVTATAVRSWEAEGGLAYRRRPGAAAAKALATLDREAFR